MKLSLSARVQQIYKKKKETQDKIENNLSEFSKIAGDENKTALVELEYKLDKCLTEVYEGVSKPKISLETYSQTYKRYISNLLKNKVKLDQINPENVLATINEMLQNRAGVKAKDNRFDAISPAIKMNNGTRMYNINYQTHIREFIHREEEIQNTLERINQLDQRN